MKGFPKRINTGKDILNCLALVQNGQLEAKELSEALSAIEARRFIHMPILSISENRKTVTVMQCAEAEISKAVKNGASTIISNVVEIPQEVAGAGEMQNSIMEITLSRALDAGETELCVVAPVNPFDGLGITENEVNSIKEVLKNYE